MAGYIIQDREQMLTLPARQVDALLDLSDGDAALLYLCLMRVEGAVTPEQLMEKLHLSALRLQAAQTKLEKLGLIRAQALPVPEPPRRPAEFTDRELGDLLRDGEFQMLVEETERALGKKLTTMDLKRLASLHREVGLPADVIFLLVRHCVENQELRYGPGRRPTVAFIEREGHYWAKRGLFDQECRLRKVQKKKKPGLSNSTVRGIHMMLHNALDRAVKEKLILTNPTENCIIPKIEKQEMKILHPDHISSYLNAAERRNALPMFYLELVSGLRKGELVALQWSDLDEANCTISVSKQASWDTEHQLILSRPKTGNSIRKVSIPQDAVELLKQEHAKHPDNPWMFPSGRTGEMYHPDSVVTLHKRILKDAGLEHIRFHDLRHTFATLALQNGVDVKTVSSMLGHYDAGFTLRTYTHATRQMQQKAAQTMGSFMAQIR